MKRPLGIVLAICGIALVIYGIALFGDSGESGSVLGLDFSFVDNDMQMQSFMIMGLGLVAMLGGFFVMKK